MISKEQEIEKSNAEVEIEVEDEDRSLERDSAEDPADEEELSTDDDDENRTRWCTYKDFLKNNAGEDYQKTDENKFKDWKTLERKLALKIIKEAKMYMTRNRDEYKTIAGDGTFEEV